MIQTVVTYDVCKDEYKDCSVSEGDQMEVIASRLTSLTGSKLLDKLSSYTQEIGQESSTCQIPPSPQ